MAMIGVLGGMGPMATADLFVKMIENTKAQTDQEHLSILIYNNPHIPSRIDAILHGTLSPEAELVRSAKLLERSGADFIVIPCNTAHFWFAAVQKAVAIPVLHIIDTVAEHLLQSQKYEAQEIMLFATEATIRTGLYQQRLGQKGLAFLTPQLEEQKLISQAIAEVKGGQLKGSPCLEQIRAIMERYRSKGVKAFIAGCTEIPLLFAKVQGDFKTVDPTLLLAQRAVQLARKLERKEQERRALCIRV